MAGCRFRLGDVDRARAEWEKFVRDFPDSPLRPRALYLIGRAYVVKGEPEEATRVFGDLLSGIRGRAGNGDPVSACRMPEEQGKLDEALGRYREIRDRYPNPEAIKVKIAGLERRIANRRG